MNTGGREIVLHSFAGGSSDGAYPYLTGLLMDAKGNLYGVTGNGGASNQGVVYRLDAKGNLYEGHRQSSAQARKDRRAKTWRGWIASARSGRRIRSGRAPRMAMRGSRR